jgi:CubicO group peptidase (beta-lactamase class C family)
MSDNLMRNCLINSFVLAGLLFFQKTHAQLVLPQVDNIVNVWSKTLKTDVVLVVANKDTIIYQKDNKLFSATRGQAPIGSSSQWLTTAVVLQLADEGKLSLDDKIADYLPEFGKYGKTYITIRHCLSHFMGIQTDSKMKWLEKKKFASLDEEVASFASKEIQSNPGTEFHYTEMGFIIAARIAEVVSKKKFDMLAQQKLFRPLGMRQTTFSTLDGSLVNPSTGARSTAADYIRFLRMLLNNGTLNSQKILSPEAVAELKKIHSPSSALKGAPKGVEGMSYALGVWAPEQRSETEAAVLVAPSFGGTAPVVDFCRGYAFVVLVKELNEDAKGNIYMDVKGELDSKFSTSCK